MNLLLTLKQQTGSLLRDSDDLWPNVLVLIYIFGGYMGGWLMLFQSSIWWYVPGVLLLMHSMVIAAYLMHDCGHNALFKKVEHNTLLGNILNTICGSNYGTYEDMRYKHMRHHVDNCEPLVFNYQKLLIAHPALHKTINILEWAYIPAVELLMHAMQIAAPFIYEDKNDQRVRVIKWLLIRSVLFVTIIIISPLAAIGYAIAYCLFLTVLRFMDNFQHSYDIVYRLNDPEYVPEKKGDYDYEQSHTYTNLISERWPLLNLLALNFSYHNAHHVKPNVAWNRLPALHASLYPQGCAQQLRFMPQLKAFHTHRVHRILAEEYGEHDVVDQLNKNQAVGVNALSFLTAF
ncbi:MAG: fatty acid desaturase [Oleibacter sp.]|nr:fatty acid desaturase [Thalassolituus sp.]